MSQNSPFWTVAKVDRFYFIQKIMEIIYLKSINKSTSPPTGQVDSMFCLHWSFLPHVMHSMLPNFGKFSLIVQPRHPITSTWHCMESTYGLKVATGQQYPSRRSNYCKKCFQTMRLGYWLTRIWRKTDRSQKFVTIWKRKKSMICL